MIWRVPFEIEIIPATIAQIWSATSTIHNCGQDLSGYTAAA